MRTNLSISIATILAFTSPNISKAQFSITAQVGGVPSVSGATLETFNEANPSILTLSGNAHLVTGNNGYTAPYFSGSTAAYFGETPNTGYDASQYVVTISSPSGSATLNFPTPQHYLGLLWGSVDTVNTLTFYNSANNVIGTVTGANILALTGDSSGDVGPNGTAYVNITSTTAFSSVVATTPDFAFEFDDVAYAVVVPEPASFILVGIGLVGLLFGFRRKSA